MYIIILSSNTKKDYNATHLNLQDLSSLVKETQLPSTKFPLITVGTAHVLHATYKAQANQCKGSP